ncbi:MAG: ATP-dependent DNA helicase [Thermofilaceae archaeon]
MELGEIWPYPAWRRGQPEIAKAVYASVEEGRHLLISYPTGAGKTAAVLTGALASATRLGVKVVYTVRARAQFQAPRRELLLLAERMKVTAVFLQNKRDLCFIRGAKLLPYDEFLNFCSELVREGLCPYYSAARMASYPESILDHDTLVRVASELKACPYEIARSMLRRADLVVAAYNYVFDPEIRRVFLGELGVDLHSVSLVVDEAHNLPYSLASILSRELSERTLRAAKREAARVLRRRDVEKDLYALLSFLRKLRSIAKANASEYEVNPADLMGVAPNSSELSRLAQLVERRLSRASALRRVAAFLRLIEGGGADYTLTAEFDGGEVKLTALCTSLLRGSVPVFSNVRSSVLMSGTMPPREYIVNLLGFEDWRVDEMRLQSPWAANIGLVAVKGVSSRYIERGEATYQAMAEYIDGLYQRLSEGLCFVVVPSYDMAKALRPYIKARPLFVEREETRLSEVEEAARKFSKMVVVVVAWGKLVEGIELRGDGQSKIKLVVVAGLPVPEPNVLNRKLLESLRHKVKSSEAAWRLVYMVPAAVKTAQAIGRSVRSELDRAAVAILDERALEPDVRSYIEGFGYSMAVVSSLDEALNKLERFLI